MREANLEELRTKYAGKQFFPKPDTVDARRWAVFTAYCQGGLTPKEVAERAGLSVSRVSKVVREVDALLDSAELERPATPVVTPVSPIEELALSARARNALHSLGCDLVSDVVRLDLSTSRGIGRKTRTEVLAALAAAGIRHTASEETENPEIRSIHRSLDRLHSRVSEALGAVTKEIAVLKKKLRKRSDMRDDGPTAA